MEGYRETVGPAGRRIGRRSRLRCGLLALAVLALMATSGAFVIAPAGATPPRALGLRTAGSPGPAATPEAAGLPPAVPVSPASAPATPDDARPADLGIGAQSVTSIPVGGAPTDAAFDPQNGYVYVANSYSNNVSVIRGTTVIASVAVGESPQFVTWDPEPARSTSPTSAAPTSA